MSLLLPGVAALVVSLILLILGQATSTIALAAAATFPAVYLLATQNAAGAGPGKESGSAKGLLEEEEERAARKANKKAKKVEDAKKKSAAKMQQDVDNSKQQPTKSVSSDDEDAVELVSGAASGGGEEKKAATKTALKKAKKEAARKAEEERLKAEAEAKKKAEDAEKKKKKKAAKKEGAAGAGAAAATSGGESPAAGKSAAAASRETAKEEAGWEVQKSDKPSSSKAAGSNKANAAAAAASKPGKAGSTKASHASAEGESKESSASTQTGVASYEEMYIPFKHHAQLIGAKGATLEKLQSTGCKIDMPKKDSGSTKVQLTGSPDAVKACKGAIESLISKGYSTVTHPGWVHDEFAVDEKHFGLIIGPQGKYIQAIQQKTSTRINLPEKDSGSHKVVIVGKKDDVRSARLAIKELISDGFSPLTHDNYVKKEVAFPKDKLHVLIGAKGQTIKSIQGNSKARINIPDRTTSPSSDSDVRITVVGTPEQVAQAEKEIARLLIPVQVVEEEPEEEYRDGTWSQAGPTEDELWD